MPTTPTAPPLAPFAVGSNGDAHPRHAIVSADGIVIAKVYGRGMLLPKHDSRARVETYGPTPETAATAALLAAAPELRDALQRCLAVIALYQDHFPGDRQTAADDARALLARIDA